MKIEGRNAVREALSGDLTIEKIVASKTSGDKVFKEIVELARAKGVKIQFVDPALLDKESATKKHQGVIAYATEFKYSQVEEMFELAKSKNEDPFILILDGIEDPHNLGSILRVCDCMGVHGVIIGKNRACSVNETVVKVSAGATTYVKVARVTNINQEIEKLKEQGVWVYACELGGGKLAKTNLTGAVAIVIGSEGQGTSKLTLKLCDGVVTIPMCGKVNSLNASVATGMVVYEVKRQRDYDRK